jgi:hypothetical protein
MTVSTLRRFLVENALLKHTGHHSESFTGLQQYVHDENLPDPEPQGTQQTEPQSLPVHPRPSMASDRALYNARMEFMDDYGCEVVLVDDDDGEIRRLKLSYEDALYRERNALRQMQGSGVRLGSKFVYRGALFRYMVFLCLGLCVDDLVRAYEKMYGRRLHAESMYGDALNRPKSALKMLCLRARYAKYEFQNIFVRLQSGYGYLYACVLDLWSPNSFYPHEQLLGRVLVLAVGTCSLGAPLCLHPFFFELWTSDCGWLVVRVDLAFGRSWSLFRSFGDIGCCICAPCA